MESLTLMAIGSEVTFKDGITGQIIGIAIHPNNYVQYNVVWWDGIHRKIEWFEELELCVGEKRNLLRLGFKNGP